MSLSHANLSIAPPAVDPFFMLDMLEKYGSELQHIDSLNKLFTALSEEINNKDNEIENLRLPYRLIVAEIELIENQLRCVRYLQGNVSELPLIKDIRHTSNRIREEVTLAGGDLVRVTNDLNSKILTQNAEMASLHERHESLLNHIKKIEKEKKFIKNAIDTFSVAETQHNSASASTSDDVQSPVTKKAKYLQVDVEPKEAAVKMDEVNEEKRIDAIQTNIELQAPSAKMAEHQDNDEKFIEPTQRKRTKKKENNIIVNRTATLPDENTIVIDDQENLDNHLMTQSELIREQHINMFCMEEENKTTELTQKELFYSKLAVLQRICSDILKKIKSNLPVTEHLGLLIQARDLKKSFAEGKKKAEPLDKIITLLQNAYYECRIYFQSSEPGQHTGIDYNYSYLWVADNLYYMRNGKQEKLDINKRKFKENLAKLEQNHPGIGKQVSLSVTQLSLSVAQVLELISHVECHPIFQPKQIDLKNLEKIILEVQAILGSMLSKRRMPSPQTGLEIKDTPPDGSCALHASLGKWNPDTRRYECANIKEARKKMADTIRNSNPMQPVYRYIKAAIEHILMTPDEGGRCPL
jgi:hypothetical protein